MVEGYVSCSELHEDAGMSSWQVVHQSSKLAGPHRGIESPKALSVVCTLQVTTFDKHLA